MQGFGLATERRPPNPAYRPCKWIIKACKDYVNNTLVINVLHASAVGGVYPRPTSNGQDTKQISRSSEDGDKPHSYGGRVLQAS